MRKVLAVAAAGFMLAFGAAFTAHSAMAGADTVHNTAEGWNTFGTDATARVTENGIRITTPQRASRVRWDTPVSGEMQTLERVTYRTFVHSDGDRGSAAPTVRINLDTDSDGTADKTLMFEPYWNTQQQALKEGEWQTWEVVKPESKLWDNDDSTQTVKTWLEWRTALQDNSVLKSISVSMGTWNEGADARVNNLRIVNKPGVVEHVWALTQVTPTPVTAEENVSAATCTEDGKLTLPEVTGVKYARTPADGIGEITVTATAEEGYVLPAKDGGWTWKVTVPAKLPANSEQCKPTPSPTTSSPTASPTTSNPGTGGGGTTTPSQTTEAPAGDNGGSNGGGGDLALTGSSKSTLLGMLGTGVLLISAGGLLFVWARRRRDAGTVESA